MDSRFIVTGGADRRKDGPMRALNTVAKYNKFGLEEYLPALNQNRSSHACASFITDSGQTVGVIYYITRSVFANDKFVKLMQDVTRQRKSEIMLLLINSLISKERRIVCLNIFLNFKREKDYYRQGKC